jgi:hypothetical protein
MCREAEGDTGVDRVGDKAAYESGVKGLFTRKPASSSGLRASTDVSERESRVRALWGSAGEEEASEDGVSVADGDREGLPAPSAGIDSEEERNVGVDDA